MTDHFHFLAIQSTKAFKSLQNCEHIYQIDSWQCLLLHPLQYTAETLQQILLALSESWFWIRIQPENWLIQAHLEGETTQVSVPTPTRQAHKQQISDFFTALGFTHATDFVRQTAPAWMQNSPTGPLPLLLESLGLKGVFPMTLSDIGETLLNIGDEEPENTPASWAQRISLRTQEIKTIECLSPPLLPISLLSQLYLLAWFADQNVEALLEVTVPAKTPAPLWPPNLKSIAFEQQAADAASHTRYVLSFDPDCSAFSTYNNLKDALYLLKDWWHDGFLLDFQIASPLPECPEDKDAGVSHRYQGNIQEAQFHLSHYSPEVAISTLEEALALSAWVEEGGSFELLSESEWQHTVERALKAFEVQEENIQRDQLKIQSPERLSRAFLAQRIFIARYRDIWPLTQAIEKKESWENSWQEMEKTILKALQKPVTGKVVLEGTSGTFLEADLSSLTSSQKQVIQTLEEELKELEFQHLGNLIWQPGGDVQFLAYGHEPGLAYATIMISMFGIFAEFFSQSDQLVSLTTTTNPNPMTQPEKGHHKIDHTNLNMNELWQEHQNDLIRRSIAPKKLKPELIQFAICIDQFLLRDLA